MREIIISKNKIQIEGEKNGEEKSCWIFFWKKIK